MNVFFDELSTPLGKFSAAVNADGALVGTAFGNANALQARIPSYSLRRDAARVREVRTQVLEFLAGERREFLLPLAGLGTAFQQKVWAELQRIPFGETRTYGQIGTAIGQPLAARAVGRANAMNPICLIVPCHRVIGADRSLTGFAFGEPLKRRLLDLEQSVRARFLEEAALR